MARGLVSFCLMIVVLSGCSSYWKRKSCEKVNWHEHGYKVAMQGQRLSGDKLMTECKKVEAEVSYVDADIGWKAGMQKYCSVEGALGKGRKGEPYSLSFCDKTKNSKVHAAYKKGILEFCQAEKAYSFAAKGGVYKDVCPKDLEGPWMVEYKRGRKVYLQGEIMSKQANIEQIEDEIVDYENERRDVLNQLAVLPRGEVSTVERQYDPDTKSYTEVRRTSEDDETADRRSDLQWQLDSVSRKIKSARSRQKNLRVEIRSLRREMRALN